MSESVSQERRAGKALTPRGGPHLAEVPTSRRSPPRGGVTEVERILFADPIWAAYAIADLQPAFAPDCIWSLQTSAAGSSATLLYHGLATPVLFTLGEPTLVAATLGNWAATGQLPARVDLAIRAEHETTVGQWFDGTDDRKPMLRMWLADASRVPAPTAGVVRLQAADTARIQALYAHGGPFTPDAFAPGQVAQGVFFGAVAADNSLVAVGGTHLCDPGERLAAIGNMYTHPAHRGQGLAAQVLAAIVHALLDGGITTIVLNVNERNDGARRLYTHFGFAIHCPFIEGVAVNKVAGSGA